MTSFHCPHGINACNTPRQCQQRTYEAMTNQPNPNRPVSPETQSIVASRNDLEACARRINEGKSTNHHAFVVLQAYSALLEKLARVEALLEGEPRYGDISTTETAAVVLRSDLETALKGPE